MVSGSTILYMASIQRQMPTNAGFDHLRDRGPFPSGGLLRWTSRRSSNALTERIIQSVGPPSCLIEGSYLTVSVLETRR